MESSPIPTQMRGIIIEKTGGVEVLQYKINLPVPSPSEGEVLIKNSFIGLNFIDTYFRTGLYPSPLPLILGRDSEGIIVSLGPSGNFYDLKVGDHVWQHGNNGNYAEYSLAKATQTIMILEALKPGTATASLLQGLTALTLIREAYNVQKGDWVLVHAAAGGVGLWLSQLLRLAGAKTIGTASTEEKIELAKRNGADYVINYKEEKDLVGKVMELTGGKGVQVVYDSIGKDMIDRDLEVTARKGAIVSYGNATGAVEDFKIARLGVKNLRLLRPMWHNYIEKREELVAYADELLNFLVEGQVNVNILETYPLADVQRAHKDIESRKTTGKLLLKP